MKRTPVNPWSWSRKSGYHPAEIVEGAKRQLICAGQTSVDADGNPQHADDMRLQITLALDNLEIVLSAAGMSLINITRLNIYTTAVDEATPSGEYRDWLKHQLHVHESPAPGG